jgi:hypothetical protein
MQKEIPTNRLPSWVACGIKWLAMAFSSDIKPACKGLLADMWWRKAANQYISFSVGHHPVTVTATFNKT